MYAKKGLILFQLKRFEEARKSYEKATAIDPKNVTNYLQMAICLIELQQYKESLAIFEKFISAWNNESSHTVHKDIDPYFYHGKSRALFFLHRYEEALEAINQAIGLVNPDIDPQFYQDQGEIYRRLAEKAFDRARQLMSNKEEHGLSHFSIENNVNTRWITKT